LFKPFFVALIEAVIDAFDLEPPEIAVMASSHSGRGGPPRFAPSRRCIAEPVRAIADRDGVEGMP